MKSHIPHFSEFSQLNSLESMESAGGLSRLTGRLTIVGTGMKALAHMTLESQAYIQQADIVLYAVADPLTADWIRKQSKSSLDMYQLYDNGKNRNITYAQMTGSILGELSKGKNVVAVFYGHPGVFAHPGHRAMVIAREEGYNVTMVPGISSEDCLYADLGIDPSRGGCQTLEATDFLIRNRNLQIDHHVILYQVGCVGEIGFNFQGFQNNGLTVLIHKLQELYGEEHQVINYISPQFSVGEPVIEVYSLKDLLRPEFSKKVTGISTFYIPPAIKKPNDPDATKQLGLESRLLYDPLTYKDPHMTPFEREAIRNLNNHKVPIDYKTPNPSKAAAGFLTTLALNPHENVAFKANRAHYLQNHPEITDNVKTALIYDSLGLLRVALQSNPEDIASQFLSDCLSNKGLMAKYLSALKETLTTSQNSFFNSLGYNTTWNDVGAAFDHFCLNNLASKANRYNLITSNGDLHILEITNDGQLYLNGSIINNFTYANSVLSWDSSFNPSSASLTFQYIPPPVTIVNSKHVYYGFMCTGFYYLKNSSVPTSINAVGKVNVYNYNVGATCDPLEFWAGTYYVLHKSGDRWGQYDGSQIIVDESGDRVIYNGVQIINFTFIENTLNWKDSDGNTNNGSVSFRMHPSADSDPWIGNEVYGQFWNKGDCRPSSGSININGSVDPAVKVNIANVPRAVYKFGPNIFADAARKLRATIIDYLEIRSDAERKQAQEKIQLGSQEIDYLSKIDYKDDVRESGLADAPYIAPVAVETVNSEVEYIEIFAEDPLSKAPPSSDPRTGYPAKYFNAKQGTAAKGHSQGDIAPVAVETVNSEVDVEIFIDIDSDLDPTSKDKANI
eukprot:gene13314-14628_t